MNREQKRAMQRAGQLAADGTPVRERREPPTRTREDRVGPVQFGKEVRADVVPRAEEDHGVRAGEVGAEERGVADPGIGQLGPGEGAGAGQAQRPSLGRALA